MHRIESTITYLCANCHQQVDKTVNVILMNTDSNIRAKCPHCDEYGYYYIAGAKYFLRLAA